MMLSLSIGLFAFGITEASAVDYVYAGIDNTNLFWRLDNDGTLIIIGNGDMLNWSSSKDIPWYSKKENIKSVEIGEYVTSIGERAFEYCENLVSVEITQLFIIPQTVLHRRLIMALFIRFPLI